MRYGPACAGRGCILHTPADQGNRAAAAVEQLDEVIFERGTGIATATLDLADHDLGANRRRTCRKCQRRPPQARHQRSQDGKPARHAWDLSRCKEILHRIICPDLGLEVVAGMMRMCARASALLMERRNEGTKE